MGPFYLNDNNQLKQNYDQKTDGMQMVTKSKVELKSELEAKGCYVRGHCGREKMERSARGHKIDLTC